MIIMVMNVALPPPPPPPPPVVDDRVDDDDDGIIIIADSAVGIPLSVVLPTICSTAILIKV